jgi:hypothetical protein
MKNETYRTQKPSGKWAAESHICGTLSCITVKNRKLMLKKLNKKILPEGYYEN